MKISRIELLSNNLIETERFYSQILGLGLCEKTGTYISFVVGDAILAFTKTDLLKPVYHFAFNIPDNQLYEAQRWISDRNPMIEFEGSPIIDFANWNAKSIYFTDNNGNVLEFIARFDLGNKSDTPFGPSAILSISEIAFVTENVPVLVEKWISTYGFSFFSKQIRRQDFSVIGEDDGLLILAGSNRNWFPTQIKAKNFPMSVWVEYNGPSIMLENERHPSARIEKADKDDHKMLTDITYTGKAFWGYDAQRLEKWKDDLTVSADYIEANETCKLMLDEKTVGYYSIRNIDDETLKLDNIFVLPEFIGKGYGKMLMLDCIAKVKKRRMKKIILDAEPNAENFYKSLGFSVYGQLESSVPNRFLPQMVLEL